MQLNELTKLLEPNKLTTEFQQVLDSIADLKTELKTEIKDSETRLEAKIEAYKLDAKLFNTKFDYSLPAQRVQKKI